MLVRGGLRAARGGRRLPARRPSPVRRAPIPAGLQHRQGIPPELRQRGRRLRRARRIGPSCDFKTHRGVAHPIEGRAVLANYDAIEDRLTVWNSTQEAHDVRGFLVTLLGLNENQVRVIAPDVGGGFGCKHLMYPEEVVVAAASLPAAPAGEMDRGPARALSCRPSRSATSTGTSRSPSTTRAACSACAGA